MRMYPLNSYDSHSALSGRVVNFQLPTRILVHVSTQQTIVYSSENGIAFFYNHKMHFKNNIFLFSLLAFILPPLFNYFDNMFSIGELIASGYACFMIDSNYLFDFMDMESLFNSQQCK